MDLSPIMRVRSHATIDVVRMSIGWMDFDAKFAKRCDDWRTVVVWNTVSDHQLRTCLHHERCDRCAHGVGIRLACDLFFVDSQRTAPRAALERPQLCIKKLLFLGEKRLYVQ